MAIFGKIFDNLKSGLSKTKDALTDKINEALKGISQEERLEIMDTAIKNQPAAQ